jgi:hypothetical protein
MDLDRVARGGAVDEPRRGGDLERRSVGQRENRGRQSLDDAGRLVLLELGLSVVHDFGGPNPGGRAAQRDANLAADFQSGDGSRAGGAPDGGLGVDADRDALHPNGRTVS